MNEIIFVVLLLGFFVVVLPVMAMVKANRMADLVRDLERQLVGLRRTLEQRTGVSQPNGEQPVRSEEPPERGAFSPFPERPQQVPPISLTVPPPGPPSFPDATREKADPFSFPEPQPIAPIHAAIPPPVPGARLPPPREFPPPPPLPSRPAASPALQKEPFNFEQFLGKKLFAWVGGLGLFIGVLLMVKYAFEAGWFPPAARITLGFLTGGGLLAGGLAIRRAELRTLAHTLAATGILVLYGVTFAAHGIYHFSAFSTLPTFGLMSLITTVAFLVAWRLPALTVALLGLLGGFLTPVLLSTGEDRPVALFCYIALLDAGLLLLAIRGRWTFLAGLAAAATWLMQAGWMVKFFDGGGYDQGTATLIPMSIFLGCGLLFSTAAVWHRKHTTDKSFWPGAAAFALWFSAVGFSFLFLSYSGIALRPALLYGFVFLASSGALHAATLTRIPEAMPRLAGGITFAHIAIWLTVWMKTETQMTGLALIFVFALLHTAGPLVLRRWRGVAGMTSLAPWSPVAGLLLTLLAMALIPARSFAAWPVILLLNAVVFAFVARGQKPITLIAAIALTLFAAFVWMGRSPRDAGGLGGMILVSGFFALFFIGGSLWLFLREKKSGLPGPESLKAADVTALSATLPFLLILVSLGRFPVPDPAPVFGLSLVLGAVLLALGRWFRQPVLSLVSVACVLLVEGTWFTLHSGPHSLSPGGVLAWQALLGALFFVWPFLHPRGTAHGLTWTTLALSTIGHAILGYLTIRSGWPEAGAMGLLPAAFGLLMTALVFVFLRLVPRDAGHRTASLAWLGGTALLFLTAIFPVQFERHWLTLGWALEGAALCWLHRRLRHPGLILAALLLLGAAFVRLILNPAVLSAYHRDGTPVWNWLLYTYGLAAAAHFLAARWYLPPIPGACRFPVRGILTGMGGVLLFALLNLEIADWFTRPDMRTIDIQNHGVFAQSMVTSICWSLFAIVTLALGLWRKSAAARYAGAGLLAVTLIKLFLHDTRAIESIYRIAAFVGVSVMTLVAAWLYQRFLNPVATAPDASAPSTDPPPDVPA